MQKRYKLTQSYKMGLDYHIVNVNLLSRAMATAVTIPMPISILLRLYAVYISGIGLFIVCFFLYFFKFHSFNQTKISSPTSFTMYKPFKITLPLKTSALRLLNPLSRIQCMQLLRVNTKNAVIANERANE